MGAPLHPRCGSDTCVKCRKKFKPGDRVFIANIVEKIGANPSNIKEHGSWFSGEFEVVHVVCDDPQINTSVIIGSRG